MDGPTQQILHGRGPLFGALILTVKTLPGGSEATIEWGAYLFVASALGSMLIPLLIEKTKASGAD